MKKDELDKIMADHNDWLNNNGGLRANLSGADLSRADLNGADLSRADLSEADLSGADLSRADLNGADLSGADLSGADLRGANLSGANLSGGDLSEANLSGANLNGADLSEADLSGADLSRANLSGADLSRAFWDYSTIGVPLACPEEGAFIAFKKADGCIIKLLVPADAKRSSATTRKCRVSKVKVLEISNGLTVVHSSYDNNFIYRLGEMVEVSNFDENRWNECSTGIHCFLTRHEAKEWA